MIYKPREDSYLLREQVVKHAFGNVLDMGTGSGIQATAAAKQERVKSVLATDIDPQVIKSCKTLKCQKIKCMQSDLFSNIKEKFDTIIINPPFEPNELLETFLSQAAKYLSPRGIILLVFTSLRKKTTVNKLIKNYGFDFAEQSKHKRKLPDEELYIYKIFEV